MRPSVKNHPSRSDLLVKTGCPTCGSEGLSVFYMVNDVPAFSGAALSTPEEALQIPHGDIILCFCEVCTFITNTAFHPIFENQLPAPPLYLERTSNPSEVLSAFRKTVGDRKEPLLFEVPDTERILREFRFWEIFYDRCSYFSAGSLLPLFRESGFDILDLRRRPEDLSLVLEARPSTGDPSERPHAFEDSQAIAETVRHFSESIGEILELHERRTAQMVSRGEKIVLWGSPLRTVSFMTTLSAEASIPYVVSPDSSLWGKFLPGLGKEIRSPQSLKQDPPDWMIVVDPVAQGEISNLVSEMGLSTQVTPAV